MDRETLTAILNTVNSILELSDGPVEGFIKVEKHDVSRSQMIRLKEGLESRL